MATETRDVEVRMKLVLDGSGAKAVNTLTGEIVAASEAHAALAASMAKPLPTPPPSTMRRAVELTSGQPVPARFLAQKIAAEQKRPVQQVDAEIGQLIGRGHLDLTPKGLRASNMGEREAEKEYQRQRLEQAKSKLGSGDGAKKGTDEAVKSEERYQDRLRRTIELLRERERLAADLKAMGYGAEEKAGPTLEERADEYRRSEQRKREFDKHLLATGARQKRPEELTMEERIAEARKKHVDQQQYQQALKVELEKHGLAERGPGRFAQLLQSGGLGNMASAIGGSGTARVLGGVGAAAMAGQSAIDISRIGADPWLTYRQRREKQIESVPLAGYAARKSRELYQGVTGAEATFQQIMQKDIPLAEIDTATYGRVRETNAGLGRQRREAAIDARAFQGLSFARPAGHDRGGVEGKLQYEQEVRLLPLKQREEVALRDRVAAEEKQRALIGDAVRLDAEYVELQKKHAAAKKKRGESEETIWKSGAREESARLAAIEKQALEEMRQVLQQKEQRQLQIREAGAQTAYRTSEHRQAQIATAGEKYQQAQQLEQRAEGQASRLGMMGVEGRMQGRFSVDMLKQIGAENAPAELLSQAASYAPETVDRMVQGKGDEFIGEARGSAEEEYKRTISQTRKGTDAAREQQVKLEEQDLEKLKQGVADSFGSVLESILLAIMEGGEVAKNNLELGKFLGASVVTQ